jgi:hypothetical protein
MQRMNAEIRNGTGNSTGQNRMQQVLQVTSPSNRKRVQPPSRPPPGNSLPGMYQRNAECSAGPGGIAAGENSRMVNRASRAQEKRQK